MLKKFKDALVVLDQITGIIFDNEDDFLDHFGYGNVDMMDLINVYFCESYVKVYYVLMSGQHVTDDIPMTEFLEWVEAYV
jgi:hypothetical protein